MKVLQIIPDFTTGGAEKVVLSYMQMLKNDQQFDVKTIVLSENKGRLYEKIVLNENLNFEFLGQDISDNSFRGRIHQIMQIRECIRREKPDVIHIHLSILWMVCLADLGLGTNRVFHTLHSDPRKTSYGKNRIIDTFCYKFFSVMPICLNEQMRDYANLIFHRKNTLVLPNGIEIEKYQSHSRQKMRSLLGIQDETFVVGHVGRFVDVKNHKKIVGVFECFHKKNPNSKLILIGEGDLINNIKNLCIEKNLSNSVLFLGARGDVPELMQAMDTFLFPSKYEGLGIVLIEAQAANLRCVISDTIPSEVIVSDNVCVLSLSQTNEEWAEAISNDVKNEKVENVLNYYSMTEVISRLKKIYIGEYY